MIASFRRSLLLLPVLLLSPLSAAAQEGGYGALPGAGVNYEMRLNAIEEQMRALTGKIEQLDFAARRLDQAMQRMQTDYEARLAKLETAPPSAAAHAPTQTAMPPAAPTARSPTAAAAAAEEEEAAPEGTLGALKVQGGKVTGGVINPKSPALPATPEDYGLTPQEQYDRAFGLLRQANYEEAEKAFKSFIDKNPKDKLLDNAKYWYAETFYVRGKFSDATATFADAYQQNPKGTKAPDSLLKLALALAQIDKKQDACVTLSELRNKYPTAPATIRARADQERARLKCAKN